MLATRTTQDFAEYIRHAKDEAVRHAQLRPADGAEIVDDYMTAIARYVEHTHIVPSSSTSLAPRQPTTAPVREHVERNIWKRMRVDGSTVFEVKYRSGGQQLRSAFNSLERARQYRDKLVEEGLVTPITDQPDLRSISTNGFPPFDEPDAQPPDADAFEKKLLVELERELESIRAERELCRTWSRQLDEREGRIRGARRQLRKAA